MYIIKYCFPVQVRAIVHNIIYIIRTGCLYTRVHIHVYINIRTLYDRDGYCNPKGRCLYTAGNYGIYVCVCVLAIGRTGNTNELYSLRQSVISSLSYGGRQRQTI